MFSDAKEIAGLADAVILYNHVAPNRRLFN